MTVDFESRDLNIPADRRAILEEISPDRATVRELHKELLEIFKYEIVFRRYDEPDDGDFFENLYWCGLLLYLVGDLADVPLMWQAKQLNMDTGGGFDVQFLVGAGLDETVRYLEEHHEEEILEYVRKCKGAKDFDDLEGWERFRIHYFYPSLGNSPSREQGSST
jgi:hypothetical protein